MKTELERFNSNDLYAELVDRSAEQYILNNLDNLKELKFNLKSAIEKIDKLLAGR